MKKTVAFFICLVLAATLVLNCAAVDVTTEKEYKALDLVIIVDKSGSMLTSDGDRMAPEAADMLISMVPSIISNKANRVGIVTFNTKAEVLGKGNGLVAIEDFAALESLRSEIEKIEYKGGTGIGNALLAAKELLEQYSDDEHAKGIVLLTDGVNDFGLNMLELSLCNDNETKALLWAKEVGCPIYCLGYDYVQEDGEASIGEEGRKHLKSIA